MFLIGGYGTGGKERQLTEIIKFLPRHDFDIYLFMKNDTSYYFSEIKEILTSYCSLNSSHFHLSDINKLNKYLRKVKPDVVFSFSTLLSHFTILMELLGLFSTKFFNGSIRDAPVKFSFSQKIEKFLYNFYNQVVSNTKKGLHVYNQNHKIGRTVLYNGFDQKRVPSMSRSLIRKNIGFDQTFNIIMVARMDHEKDHTTFIKAAHEVLKTDKNLHFYLIGDGENFDKYVCLTKKLGLTPYLTFLGEVDHVENYFKAADISILASGVNHGEGIPNVVMESLACGTPVIATDNGGTTEILIDNYNGYVITNGNYIKLAEKILFMKKNPKKLQSLSNNASEHVKINFSIENMIDDFLKIIQPKILG